MTAPASAPVEPAAPGAARPAAPGRLTFNRPPRLSPGLSAITVDVPAPPAPVQKPSNSFAGGLIIPLIAVLAMGGLFLGSALSGGNTTYVIVAVIALGIGTAVPTAWSFFEERRRFRQRARDQVDQYGRRVRNAEAELARLRDAEQALRLQADPPPSTLLGRASQRSRRLFERRLADPDFLSLRLGVGLAPSRVEIRFGGAGVPQIDEAHAGLAALMRDAQHLVEQYRQVPDVPIGVGLTAIGALGLAGPYARLAPLARAALAQAAAHHSPDDLQIAAFLERRPLDDWAWLKWLPQTRGSGSQPRLAWDAGTHAGLSRWLLDELTGRKRILDESSSLYASGAGPPAVPWLLVFVDDLRLVPAEPALRLALADGQRLHVALLGLADDMTGIPGGCRGVGVLDERGDGLLTLSRVGQSGEPDQCVPDALAAEDAEAFARALAPLDVLDESPAGQASDIPARLSFFEALDIPSVEAIDVAARWQPAALDDLLRTPLGPTAGGDLVWLDLKEQSQHGHGPHGLVAGTTGAGKSELLLTLIAGLALRHPPDVLNFVLIDYKGGDAFQSVASLPHTIALITDLDRHLAERALLTLRSEIKRREHRLLELRSAGISSLAEYQVRRGDREPMPFLVILVDEFARLKDDLPEFINGLIDVARVGRSLGVHLILATQTPSGTVDDQIQKNTNFGLCLRVRDQLDSKQVIGEPDAALLPGSLPGRGYFRAGLDPVRLFQTARVGAPYQPRAVTNRLIEVEPFEPRTGACLPTRPQPASAADAQHPATSEVRALVAYLREAAMRLGTAATPWPAPLPEVIALVEPATPQPSPDTAPADTSATDSSLKEENPSVAHRPAPPAPLTPFAASAPLDVPTVPALVRLPPHGWSWPRPADAPDWLAPPVGLIDEPIKQAQRPFHLDVARNCLIYGAAGSGKSTLLRTLATSLALHHAPSDLHLYCLDFDARTLAPLAGLPHVGEAGVFFPRETVRIRRLFRLLEHTLQERREAGVTNLRQQRRADPSSSGRFAHLPFIVVLLDNFAAFRETFEEEENLTRSMDSMVADLATLMRDGPAAGIHFVLTAGLTGGMANAIANAAETRVVLRQNDPTDYSLVGRFESPPERVPPGRGFASGTPPREFQIALLPDEVDAIAQLPTAMLANASTAALFSRLRDAAGSVRPPAVQDLPAWLSIDDPRLSSRPEAVSGTQRRPERARLPLVLGLDDERFQPLVLDLAETQHLIVAGPPGSGKSSLLGACALQLLHATQRGRVPPAQMWLVLPRPSALAELGRLETCAGIARNTMQLGQLLDDLDRLVEARREALRADADPDATPIPEAPLLLLIDDYEQLRQDDDFYDIESRLGRLARRGTAVGLHLIVAGSNVELRDGRDEVLRYLSQLRVGVLLQPDTELDGDLFNVRLRRLVEAAPVGRGYFVLRQQQRLFQSVTPQREGLSLQDSIRLRIGGAWP